MAGRQSHFIYFSGIPRCYNYSPACWIFLDKLYSICKLVNFFAVRSFPFSPLNAINPSQVAFKPCLWLPVVSFCICCPDCFFFRIPCAMENLSQPSFIIRALNEPQQLRCNAFPWQFFCCYCGKSIFNVKAHLHPENSPCPCACPVLPVCPIFKNMPQGIKVLFHFSISKSIILLKVLDFILFIKYNIKIRVNYCFILRNSLTSLLFRNPASPSLTQAVSRA